MSRNRRAHDEEGSGYNWMDTYGDLVTNLLCFFVLLYSFSSIDNNKWQALVGSFTGGSTRVVETFTEQTVREDPIHVEGIVSTDEDSKDTLNVKDENKDEFDALYYAIKTYVEDNDWEAEILVAKQDDSILVRFQDVVLFDSGKAYIREDGKDVLDHIFQLIGNNLSAVRMVRIEGHTDNVPIHTSEFKNNWELSMGRSNAVLEYFIQSGWISMDKLSAAAYGEYQPVDSNSTPEGRAANRRVDFVIEKLISQS
ncbi:OmpA/MotB family protein [Papillibacter cinnamivorans]|uniref:Chemotaxis protein MotB n=1 Tax=Papillibacter cinnamivorans DSM 12816 TaxID=1122930 RepID=A0A1W1YHY8_9FIRM|nr:flagellar motor protein MotB [Papillibacter cinnamivorans]SMC35753.1 chemotaxis protein MotB [Papillibacter cinnamivorans DSM 12816]